MGSSTPTYISLFSGAGGLDIGLEKAGWRTAFASDNDPFAIATIKANAGRFLARGKRAFDGTHVEQADIRLLDARLVLSKAGMSRGNVQLLAGGPPCQSWSSAGHQRGFNDPRGQLFDDFVRLADKLDARWLLLENVRGLLTARGPDGMPGSALGRIRQQLFKVGFQTSVALINAADFGVPQRRVRLFMVGFRSGDAPPWPEATHSKLGDSRPRWISLGDALGGVGRLDQDEIIRPSGKMARDLELIPAGSGVKSQGKSERTRPGGHWGYKQGAFIADLGQSARTVTASAQQDWIRDPILGLRRLSPRECAAIQTFPSSWAFEGRTADKYRLIGNAVPPLLAEAIGAALMDSAQSVKRYSGSVSQGLMPLPAALEQHVRYTLREEVSNGASRRAAPTKRRARAPEMA